MLDLRKAQSFIEAMFEIRSRRHNRPIAFRLNESQQRIMEKLIEHADSGKRAYAIFCKARRLGVTTFIRALTQCAIMEKQYSEAIIMAQLKPVASSIYQESLTLARQLPLGKEGMQPTQQVCLFPRVPASLTWNTANSVKGTRGLAYTHLHATEAAYYEDAEVFTSVLNTLSDDPENMAYIETTANGTEGPGAAYHELWTESVAGRTEFLPIFLPWHEDPEYVMPPLLARGAPRDDYEKYLMKDLKLPPERIAFFRYTLANKCSNRLEKWRREYPGTAEEAFEVTGVPVFDFEDTTAAHKGAREPFDTVEIKITRGRQGFRAYPERNQNGRFKIFETPQPRAHYFLGVVVGSGGGDEEDSLAAVMWNGETGNLAARFQDTLHPATASELMAAMGYLYNRAQICVHDGNGGFGAQINQELRDRWRYPNVYRWKGRNDRVHSDGISSKSTGFSFTEVTRKMMLNGFIASLKREEVVVTDRMFSDQMPSAQWEASYPYEAYAGEDDVFWAGVLGWTARTQHHPRRCDDYVPTNASGLYEDIGSSVPHQKSPFNTPLMGKDGRLEDEHAFGFNLQHHLDKRDQRERELV